MKRFLLIVILVALAGGGLYLGGYWPERQRRLSAEQGAADARTQFEDVQARVRLFELADQVVVALHHLSDRNFGLARDEASRFFEAARAELSRTQKPEIRSALETALQPRDSVITALSQGDPAAVRSLYQILERLRQAAGRPPLPGLAAGGLPAAPAAAPVPSPSPVEAPPVPAPSPTSPAASPFAPSPLTTLPPPTPQP